MTTRIHQDEVECTTSSEASSYVPNYQLFSEGPLMDPLCDPAEHVTSVSPPVSFRNLTTVSFYHCQHCWDTGVLNSEQLFIFLLFPKVRSIQGCNAFLVGSNNPIPDTAYDLLPRFELEELRFTNSCQFEPQKLARIFQRCPKLKRLRTTRASARYAYNGTRL